MPSIWFEVLCVTLTSKCNILSVLLVTFCKHIKLLEFFCFPSWKITYHLLGKKNTPLNILKVKFAFFVNKYSLTVLVLWSFDANVKSLQDNINYGPLQTEFPRQLKGLLSHKHCSLKQKHLSVCWKIILHLNIWISKSYSPCEKNTTIILIQVWTIWK